VVDGPVFFHDHSADAIGANFVNQVFLIFLAVRRNSDQDQLADFFFGVECLENAIDPRFTAFLSGCG
jgi:hypothetical protein